MIGTVYVEEAVRDHPRSREVLGRLPAATVVPIARYGEVFNPRQQSFRLQKAAPALILAEKFAGHVLAAPAGYGLPGHRGFYFSHMLNCLYDCRYCFLQGMFRSAALVVFVNFEAFEEAIDARLAEPGGPPFFFSGFDCDSLAFEGVTGFAASFLRFFERRPQAWLELRTKSAAVEALTGRKPLANVVVAWSLSPDEVARHLEDGAPTLAARLRAMERVAARGWRIGIRFDPLIYHEGYVGSYRRLFEEVFARLPQESVHSVSLGLFRLPRPFFRALARQRPDEAFLAAPMQERDGLVSLREDLAAEMREECSRALLEHIPRERFAPCFSGEAAASA